MCHGARSVLFDSTELQHRYGQAVTPSHRLAFNRLSLLLSGHSLSLSLCHSSVLPLSRADRTITAVHCLTELEPVLWEFPPSPQSPILSPPSASPSSVTTDIPSLAIPALRHNPPRHARQTTPFSLGPVRVHAVCSTSIGKGRRPRKDGGLDGGQTFGDGGFSSWNRWRYLHSVHVPTSRVSSTPAQVHAFRNKILDPTRASHPQIIYDLYDMPRPTLILDGPKILSLPDLAEPQINASPSTSHGHCLASRPHVAFRIRWSDTVMCPHHLPHFLRLGFVVEGTPTPCRFMQTSGLRSVMPQPGEALRPPVLNIQRRPAVPPRLLRVRWAPRWEAQTLLTQHACWPPLLAAFLAHEPTLLGSHLSNLQKQGV